MLHLYWLLEQAVHIYIHMFYIRIIEKHPQQITQQKLTRSKSKACNVIMLTPTAKCKNMTAQLELTADDTWNQLNYYKEYITWTNVRHESSSLKSPHWLISSHRSERLMQRPLLHANWDDPHPTVHISGVMRHLIFDYNSTRSCVKTSDKLLAPHRYYN